jgi:serine/threonine-protein kinase TTK/MPS1
MLDHGHGFNANAPVLQDITYGDSSDDEIPPPMNFSALTKALLEDRPSRGRSPPPGHLTHRQALSPISARLQSSRAGTPSQGSIKILRQFPALVDERDRKSPPRVVHLSGSRGSSVKKSYAEHDQQLQDGYGQVKNRLELVTPAPMPRKRPAVSRVNSTYSAGPPSHSSSAANQSGISSDYANTSYVTQATSVERDPSVVQDDLVKSRIGDQPQGSVRMKRSGLGQGTLRGAPMRRPFRRTASGEGGSPSAEPLSASRLDHESAQEDQEQESHHEGLRPSKQHVEVHDFARRPPDPAQTRPRGPSLARDQVHVDVEVVVPRLPKHEAPTKPIPQPAQEQPIFKMPAPPPPLPSMDDQENEPPPTFKRNKPQASHILGAKLSVLSEDKELKMLAETPAPHAHPRQALAIRSINTPQRAAPPPPKMSVLETVTATAGASTVKKKKRTHITLNGKVYSLRGRLGKGGSSDVYRVMAENDKMFALKKVNLDDCNEETIRGYKGEIDLLKKLENVERVVRLFDWEVNETKQSLSVLMEIGESDLNRVLQTRIHPDDAKLDLNFTRFYWREMLECVQAVHAYDIVHSDLKPANFLLVQGRLKLIDFGIANAIEDNTVNVHRETNVGTPNYMSPESLQDTNADERAAAGAGGAANIAKCMKLGKPSDVWTLGCILYQMTYGKPPFAHIANQWNRVMAIINPKVQIQYPDTGIGGVTIPSSLKRVLRSCLNRDQSQRPTLEELLGDREPFLNPDIRADKWEADGAVPMTENILKMILDKITERSRDPNRGIPTDAENKQYAGQFLERVRLLLKE